MTPSRFFVVLVFVATIFVVTAYGGGFQLNEVGSRAMAQAGAFAARATDGSAIYFNPAGLGFQTQGSVLVGITLIDPIASFYGPLEDNSNTKYSQKNQTFTPVNGYFVYPIMNRLTVGVGVNNQFGLGTEWPSDWPGRYLAQKTDLTSWFVTPTASYRITDQFSVGAGFVWATGNVRIYRPVYTGGVQTAEPVISQLDLSGHGYGFSAGLLYKITPDLSIGGSYRSQVKVNAAGSANFFPNYAPLKLPQGDVSSSITLPATGFLGVAYKPMENLAIEADYQFIGWSSFQEFSFNFSADNSTVTSPRFYKDTYILRIGGEYTMDQWQFRAGYLYDHSPVQSQYVEPILPDANRNGANVGVGYDVTPNWNLSLAYFFLKFSEQVVTNSVPQNSFDGTYHTYANLFAVNIEYKF